MSLLEVIVFLGIVAGAMGMLAASLADRHSSGPDTFERIAGFIRDVRLDAIESGEDRILYVSPQALRSSTRQLDWGGAARLRIGDPGADRGTPERRVLIDANGAIEAAPLHLVEGDHDRELTGVYRAPVTAP